MKLSDNFIVHTEDGQTLLVPTAEADFHGVLRGNQTLKEVLDLLKSETEEEAIVRAITERYEADSAEVEKDVALALKTLREIGALDE